MTNIVKNQHYVPRFYLNYFVNEIGRIFVYDKFTLTSFAANPTGIASEGYFYDIIKGKHQVIETVLNAKFEIPFSNFLPIFIGKLENHQHFKVKKFEKEAIAAFLSYQYIRTKRFREESVRLFDDSNIYLSEAHFPPQLGHIFVLSDPKIQEGIYNNLLNNYYWIFGRNQTDKLFYTSDHPLVQKETLQSIHNKNSDSSFADFTLLDEELSFPITPKYNITFYKKNKMWKHLKRFDGRRVDVNDTNVEWYNGLQILRSYRQIYSSDNDFSFIEIVEERRRKQLIEEGVPADTIRVPTQRN